MAYSATITWSERKINGRKQLTIKAVETQARDTSVWRTNGAASSSVTNADNGLGGDIPIYPTGVIKLYEVKLNSGTGTTVQPAAGKTASFSTSSPDTDLIALQSIPAAFIIEQTEARYSYSPSEFNDGQIPTMFFKSQPNDTTSDHSITTILVIMEGHA